MKAWPWWMRLGVDVLLYWLCSSHIHRGDQHNMVAGDSKSTALIIYYCLQQKKTKQNEISLGLVPEVE